ETCTKCHGPDKSKGDLRLDNFELAMLGGELGDTIVPGDLDASEIIYRLHLDLDDDERMPPEGKPQPSDSQIAILEWWVESGAPDAGLLSELELPETIETAMIAQLEQPAFVAEEEAMVAELDVPSWDEIADTVAELQEDPRINLQPIALDSPLIRVKAPYGESKFDDEALAMLAPVAANIAELEIGFSDVTNDGLAALSGMTNLERLYLQKTAISDEGLKHVANLENLRYLNLYGTQISDSGLEYLEDLDELKSLYLWETQVTPAGAKAFQASALDQSQINDWEEEIKALKQKIKQSGILVETGAEEGPSS
ncbi:MAG: c-type cytochrome domain-containing protein, partial [Verrucomicrobiia bacterium]